MADKLIEKTIYRTHTIFKYSGSSGVFYRTQNGISKSKFKSLGGAQKAIDKMIEKTGTGSGGRKRRI